MKRNIFLLLVAAAIPMMSTSVFAQATVEGESPLAVSSAVAAPAPPPASPQDPSGMQLSLRNPISHEMESLSMNQVASADKMRDFVAPLPNATGLYDTYLAQGYFPLHALILTNWDISEIMRTQSPSLPDNPALREKIAGIHKLYQPEK
jgi:hypothetical protein